MLNFDAPSFELSRQARRAGTERSLVRRERSGELARVRAGVYLPTKEWQSLGVDGQYRARVLAAATSVREGTQFGFDSAASLWGLPGLGPWSHDIHVLGPRATGGRSSSGIRRHAMPLDLGAQVIDGATTTSVARTVVSVACLSEFARAVCMVDNALRPPVAGELRAGCGLSVPSKSDLFAAITEMAPFPGLARAKLATAFGNALSGSIGESLSRAQIHLLGFPAPQLQVPFYDADGLIGFSDFYWPEFGLIGEFDGRVKYGNTLYLRGQLPEEVVWAEKLREDRLRACVRDLVRWDWSVARDQRRLAERLRAHGLTAR